MSCATRRYFGATAATPLRVFPWLLYLLALHPDIEARLHEELERILAGRAPDTSDIPRLPYLRQIVDETLRLYPPAPTMLRTAAADDEVCGHRVPRGSVVGVLPWVIHRHRTLWDDPDRFDPGRFTPEAVAARSRYAYLPFAIGPRICIGASLALVEIVTAMAVIAQRFRFRLAPGYPIEPIAWTNLHPKGGILDDGGAAHTMISKPLRPVVVHQRIPLVETGHDRGGDRAVEALDVLV